MVESIPQLVTLAQLKLFKKHLPNVKLIVGVGLHSLNSQVRELLVNSVVTLKSFLVCCELLRSFNYMPKVYLMIKPPFFSEQEASKDLFLSVNWLIDKQITEIALTRLRIFPNTLIDCLYSMGYYSLLNLNTVLNIIIQLRRQNINFHMSFANLQQDDYISLVASGCNMCKSTVLDAIVNFNNLSVLELESKLCVACSEYIAFQDSSDYFRLPIEQRVIRFIKEYKLYGI